MSSLAVAQLEVQVGAGALFSKLNFEYNGDFERIFSGGKPAIRPYVSGLIGVPIAKRWQLSARGLATSRSDGRKGRNISSFEERTDDAIFIDLGAEIQWEFLSNLGVSVGPYFSLNAVEFNTRGNFRRRAFINSLDNYLSIRPALALTFDEIVLRLDASIGLTPSRSYLYLSSRSTVSGGTKRYWNGASIGVSYRLRKA